jgi:hypothetical protein
MTDPASVLRHKLDAPIRTQTKPLNLKAANIAWGAPSQHSLSSPIDLTLAAQQEPRGSLLSESAQGERT